MRSPGKESITLMTGEGKMRLVMTKKNGIELINELGDIAIECKKLTLDAEKNIDLEAKKAITVAGEGEVSPAPLMQFRQSFVPYKERSFFC